MVFWALRAPGRTGKALRKLNYVLPKRRRKCYRCARYLMTNAARILLFCLVFTPAVFAQSLAPSASPSPAPRKLIVGIWSAPPFNIRQVDGSWTGISVELWREAAPPLTPVLYSAQ